MEGPAAKERRLWPALVAVAALLLAAPLAFASRTASARPELLAGPAIEQAPAAAHALAVAYTPRGFELHASTDPRPAAFALFDDLTPASERLEPEKLASGVASWELTPNLQRIQQFVAETWWVREHLGPVDSPNLYQAFGLDPMNLTDPYGFSIWGDLVEATKFIGGMYLGAAKHAVTSIPKTVEAVVSLVPTKAVDAYFAASAVVAGYQAHGFKGAARAYVGEVKQTVSDVVQMVPFVAAIREAQCVDQTIVRAGAFAGGMQAGELADRVRIEGATLLMVASSLRATPRAAAAEPVAVDLNEVSEGLKSQWKSVAPESAAELRNGPGIAFGGSELPASPRAILRGTEGNAGLIPREIAERLSGRQFGSFKEFRQAFWREVAESPYAAEFQRINIRNLARMRKGYAPLVRRSQMFRGQFKYILHHRMPISQGGAVYDLENLLISSPRYHAELLDAAFHAGR